MESTLKKITSGEYELTVELGVQELSGYVENAEKQLSKDFELEGFRKGKVPRDLLRKQLGEPVILEAALDIAFRDSLAKVIKEKELEIMKVSDLKIVENSPQKLLYRVLLTLFPSVEIPNLENIKVKRKEIDVQDNEVKDAIDGILISRASFLDKQGKVEAGNRVEIDFEATIDGKPIEGGISRNHPLIAGKNVFMPGFEDNLIGMARGEEKRFTLRAPDNYFREELAGKNIDFAVKIGDIKRVQAPLLNDEFAKSLGRFKDAGELVKSVREGIFEEKKLKGRQRLLSEIIEQIIQKSKIEVTGQMIERKLDEMIYNFDQELHQNGLELGPYLAHINKTQEDLRQDWRADADKKLKAELVLQRIAKEQKISAEDSEIKNLMEQTIQIMTLRDNVGVKDIDLNKLRDDIAAKIINEKTLNYVESACAV